VIPKLLQRWEKSKIKTGDCTGKNAVVEGGEEVEAGAEFDFIDGSGEIGEILERQGELGTMAACMVLRSPSIARTTLKVWLGTATPRPINWGSPSKIGRVNM
jgi:hypothetical protein